MYDFHKSKDSNNGKVFYHPKFQRDDKRGLRLIKRKAAGTVTGTETETPQKKQISTSEINQMVITHYYNLPAA